MKPTQEQIEEFKEINAHYARYKRREERKSWFAFGAMLVIILFFALLAALYVITNNK
jgi:hypothetical protein